MHQTVNPGEYLLSDSVWRADDTRRYAERGCDAVFLAFGDDIGRKLDLTFLSDLPGLRRVAIEGPLRDDTLVFELEDLLGLALMTRSKKAVRLDRTPKLDTLLLSQRPGLETIGALAALEYLTINRCTGSDLTLLGAKPELVYLRIEGRYGPLALRGIEAAPKLRQLEVIDATVESLEPLADLVELQELVVRPNSTLEPPEPLRLDPVANLPDLHTLRLGAIASAAPLAVARGLRRLVVGTVLDGDLRPLIDLPDQVTVTVLDDAAQNREVQRLRRAGRGRLQHPHEPRTLR
ncbi:hypothetical protein [Dactylosporangium sp. NPDC051484]|uniref:hypothetical protein n=1 Tax=Dactylosporangium sp. NPDC051484 TaxID=3154942 RepID=UPI00344BFE44